VPTGKRKVREVQVCCGSAGQGRVAEASSESKRQDVE